MMIIIIFVVITIMMMMILRYYIKREKWAGDKVSLHSGMDGSFRGSVRKYESL